MFPKLVPGTLALVTFGPSAGTVVRLERTAYAPPGCSGRAIHTLQPGGPVWVVDKWLEWDVDRDINMRLIPTRRYRLCLAPWTALEPISVRDNVINTLQKKWAETRALLSEWFARQPHAPASPAARDEVIDELFAVMREAPQVEQAAPDLSDMDAFHRKVATGELVDTLHAAAALDPDTTATRH
jgi:hypothetical protein